jgi:hypothetical protein
VPFDADIAAYMDSGKWVYRRMRWYGLVSGGRGVRRTREERMLPLATVPLRVGNWGRIGY